MAAIYDIQGYGLVLEKVAFVTRVFEAAGNAGAQFNVRVDGGRLQLKFPNRAEATLARDLLIKALREL